MEIIIIVLTVDSSEVAHWLPPTQFLFQCKSDPVLSSSALEERHLDDCVDRVCLWNKIYQLCLGIWKTTLHNLTNFECSHYQTIMATFQFVEEMLLLGYFMCF